jgi:hypothetical protein
VSVDPLISGAVAHVIAAHSAPVGTVSEQIAQQLVKANTRRVDAPTVAEATGAALARFRDEQAQVVVITPGVS